jgi:hypothetical protein
MSARSYSDVRRRFPTSRGSKRLTRILRQQYGLSQAPAVTVPAKKEGEVWILNHTKLERFKVDG